MRRLSRCVFHASCLWLLIATTAQAQNTEQLLRTIQQVGREGRGNVEAQTAMRQLTRADGRVLPEILRAFDEANPLAANWMRGAFETIAERELHAGRTLPTAGMERYVRNRKHNPRARRLAYEWLLKVDKTAADRLIPGMLDDPSPEFRRDAVGRLIKQAKSLNLKSDRRRMISLYRQALTGAVDKDQVQAIVRPLKRLGVTVDLQKHFGFLTRWHLIGPFDNRGGIGFAAVYPPEKELSFTAVYKGQLGKVRWMPATTKNDYGIFDIAKSIKPYKGAVMYAVTNFVATKSQPAQLRLGTPNAWKLWVNGKLLFAREEYHRGMKLDQYQVRVNLKPGRNVILLKICQNEQTQSWAQRYQFQLRVCDFGGRAILPQTALSATPSIQHIR